MSKSEEISCVHCAYPATRGSILLHRSITMRRHMNVCRVHLCMSGRRSAHSAKSIQSVPFLRSCGTIIHFTNISKRRATRIPEIRVFHHQLYFWSTGSSCRKSALRNVRKDTTAPPRIETTCQPLSLPLETVCSSLFENSAIYAEVKFPTGLQEEKKVDRKHPHAPLTLKAQTVFCATYILVSVQSLVSSNHKNQWWLTCVDPARSRVQVCVAANMKRQEGASANLGGALLCNNR